MPSLRVTLTHCTLFSYEQALCLPTSFPISGLARLGVKPRLCRLSWRTFASTHPLTLPSTSPREALLACPPFPPGNLPSFTVESTLSSPCPRSDPPLFRQGAALLLLLLFTRSLPRDGGMAEDHGAPEAGQLLRVWTRGRTETESRQRVSGAKSP